MLLLRPQLWLRLPLWIMSERLLRQRVGRTSGQALPARKARRTQRERWGCRSLQLPLRLQPYSSRRLRLRRLRKRRIMSARLLRRALRRLRKRRLRKRLRRLCKRRIMSERLLR